MLFFGESLDRNWGLSLETPGNVSGPKANFKIKTCWMVAQFLAHKPVNLASLTVSYIASFSKLLKIIDSFPGQKS